MLWIALPLLLLQSPARVPRDAPPPKTGTGVIRGRVTAADTGQPMRRATVYLSRSIVYRTTTVDGMSMIGGEIGRPRSVATRADGRYEFTGLPPGSYAVHATPGPTAGAYLPSPFGADDTSRGKPIELAEGQRVQSDIVLQRGGVIVGRVVDESGEPLTRASVQASRFRAGELQPGGRGFQTDDFGRFRLFGLMPGEYIVSAEARTIGPPVDASEGFVTTFFPSVLNEREASRVRVAAGLESGDVEIRMVRTRTFRITGTVVNSRGEPVARPEVMLVRQTTGSSFDSSGGFGRFAQSAAGRFTMLDVVPGDYRLVVRLGSTSGKEGSLEKPRAEYAVHPVSVTADIEDIVLMTRPGVSVGGQVIFAEGIPPKPVSMLRIGGEPAERFAMVGGSAPVAVDESLQFTLTDLFGPQLVRVMGLTPPFALKAVMLGAADITDTPTEFRPEHRLQVVVTARASSVEGTVSDDAGRPGANAMVIVLPEDKRSWSTSSPRVRMTGASPDGKFTLGGLVDGRYYVVAVPPDGFHLSPATPSDAFALLAREATLVVLGEDETRTVDLRLVKAVRR